MLFRNHPTVQEVEEILHKSSSYVNKEGEHPYINSCLDANKINLKGSCLQDDEWIISENIDKNLLDKMKNQISSIQIYKQGINIFFE